MRFFVGLFELETLLFTCKLDLPVELGGLVERRRQTVLKRHLGTFSQKILLLEKINALKTHYICTNFNCK